MYQGALDMVGDVSIKDVSSKNILTHLNTEAEWIEENLEELSGNVKAIENVLQDLSGSYYTTIYKLTHLQ